MTSSEGEGQPPPRKRSRTSANGDEVGNKKARGRPRVDTQDATAADRRRTQIRLAQRAYRQRKESTISSLKQETAQLQTIIEQMNTSFLRFNESALKSGLLSLNPALGRELKHVTETFVTLAKSAVDQRSHDEEEDAGEAALDPAAELHDAAHNARASRERPSLPQPQHTQVGWGYSATMDEAQLEGPLPPKYTPPSLNGSLQQRNFFQETYGSSNNMSLVRSSPKPMLHGPSVGQLIDQSRSISPLEDTSQQPTLPFGLVDRRLYSPPLGHNTRIFSVNIPSPLDTPRFTKLPSPPLLPNLSMKTLKPSWTYSHDETTFARRLTRASLEAGFHLLSSANLRPAALSYVFRLSLPYKSIEEIRDRFKMILGRGTDEELDAWDTPFIHLGGAGTHYPRKDANGNTIPIPNSWTVRSIGPPCAKLVRAESSTDSSQDHDLKIDLTGFEGEWFDAYDVQGYIEQEKGCHIDPKDSFAEVFVDVEADEQQQPPDEGDMGSIVFSKKMSLDFSGMSNPGLSSGSSNSANSSNKTTPGNSSSSMDSVFGNTQSQSQSDAPFGLDMGVNPFDFGKFNDIDPSTLYDQPLGLDLAPGFDVNLSNMNTGMSGFNTATFGDMSNLGLDLMGGEMHSQPRKQKKAAWLDVTKFIDEMIKHGVCLGRAPGFRRKDVDVAFSAALISSF